MSDERDERDQEARRQFGGAVADALPLIDAELTARIERWGEATDLLADLLLEAGFSAAQVSGILGGSFTTTLTGALLDRNGVSR